MKTQSSSVKTWSKKTSTLQSTLKNTKSKHVTPNSVKNSSPVTSPTSAKTHSATLMKMVSSEWVQKSEQGTSSLVRSLPRAKQNSLPKKDCSAQSLVKRSEKSVTHHSVCPTAKTVSLWTSRSSQERIVMN